MSKRKENESTGRKDREEFRHQSSDEENAQGHDAGTQRSLAKRKASDSDEKHSSDGREREYKRKDSFLSEVEKIEVQLSRDRKKRNEREQSRGSSGKRKREKHRLESIETDSEGEDLQSQTKEKYRRRKEN